MSTDSIDQAAPGFSPGRISHTPLLKAAATSSSFPFLERLSARGRVIITATDSPAQRFDTVFPEFFVEALDEQSIAGCALDTTDPEPLTEDHPLRGRDNVIINPHVAWYSEQAMAGLQAGAPGEVRRILQGEWPKNVVNKAVKDNNRAGI
ncbi:MAG: hypothetical protein IH804_05020 [Planctomycetes bacterium]|nr:hypothetical protein [Planctomycetota bacterium]